jgi:hypothetical protein
MRNNQARQINFATVCRTPLDSPGGLARQGFELDLDQTVGDFSLVSSGVKDPAQFGTFV